MSYKTPVLILLMLTTICLYSQKQIIDTIAINYYKKYQTDPETGKKNGLYEEYYNNKLITSGEFKFGVRDGEWKFYYQNDTIQQEGKYLNGKKIGKWIFYYSNGNIACETPYNEGEINGIQIARHPNGIKSFEAPTKKNLLEGVVTYYFDNGKIEYSNTYLNDSLNGISKKYYRNGNLMEVKYIKNQERDSIYTRYYENGTLWEKIFYKNGNPYSVISYNKSNGQKLDCCTLVDGNGIMRFYDAKGRITSKLTFSKNKKNGNATYYENGILKSEGYYENNMRIGAWKEYYKTGELKSIINYESDLKNGKAVYYFKEGGISQEGTNLKDEREGRWIKYNQNKQIYSALEFKSGQLEGNAKYYYEGKTICEGEYYFGEKTNIWNYYYYDKKVKYESQVNHGDKNKVNITKVDKYDDALDLIEEEDKTLPNEERTPTFIGGDQEMMLFIQKNIYYSNQAKVLGISGTVYIQFNVLPTGEIDQKIRVLRGVYPTLDEEAIRIVSIMPRWNPGSQYGKPVSVTFNLPIKYTLK